MYRIPIMILENISVFYGTCDENDEFLINDKRNENKTLPLGVLFFYQ